MKPKSPQMKSAYSPDRLLAAILLVAAQFLTWNVTAAINCFTPDPSASSCPASASIAFDPLGDTSGYNSSAAVISGDVTGFDPRVSSVVISVQVAQPAPNDISPPAEYCAVLNAGGHFSQTVSLKLGNQIIIATVKNLCGNIIGSASVRIINLPQAIRDRYTSEGGSSQLQDLQWTLDGGKWKIAVYKTGFFRNDLAIAYILPTVQNAGYSVTIPGGPIFDKWKQWVSKPYHAAPPNFCPLAQSYTLNTTATPTINVAQFQDFGSGRIYYIYKLIDLPHSGTFFVPRAFTQVLDTLEAVAYNSGVAVPPLPFGDPLECPEAHTWIFQQFQRVYPFDNQPITIEIKGDPATLWIERRGGDLRAKPQCVPFGLNMPAIFQGFPCACPSGDCAFSALPALVPPWLVDGEKPPAGICKNIALETIPDELGKAWDCVKNGNLFCAGQHIQAALNAIENAPGEWIGVNGDYSQTSVSGFLQDNFLANDDLGFTHRTAMRVNESFLGIHYNVSSDWNFYLHPFAQYANALTLPQLTDPICNKTHLEVEIEAFDMGILLFDLMGRRTGKAGDFMFVSGRWMIDCGHADFAAEIHPPGVIAISEAGESGNVTTTTLSVNGYYTGSPVTLELYPPPRPAPNAFLQLTRAELTSPSIVVGSDFDSDLSSYLRVHIAAPLQFPAQAQLSVSLGPFTSKIGYLGQLIPLQRSYYSQLSLGWQTYPYLKVANYDY